MIPHGTWGKAGVEQEQLEERLEVHEVQIPGRLGLNANWCADFSGKNQVTFLCNLRVKLEKPMIGNFRPSMEWRWFYPTKIDLSGKHMDPANDFMWILSLGMATEIAVSTCQNWRYPTRLGHSKQRKCWIKRAQLRIRHSTAGLILHWHGEIDLDIKWSAIISN